MQRTNNDLEVTMIRTAISSHEGVGGGMTGVKFGFNLKVMGGNQGEEQLKQDEEKLLRLWANAVRLGQTVRHGHGGGVGGFLSGMARESLTEGEKRLEGGPESGMTCQVVGGIRGGGKGGYEYLPDRVDSEEGSLRWHGWDTGQSLSHLLIIAPFSSSQPHLRASKFASSSASKTRVVFQNADHQVDFKLFTTGLITMVGGTSRISLPNSVSPFKCLSPFSESLLPLICADGLLLHLDMTEEITRKKACKPSPLAPEWPAIVQVLIC